MKKIFLLALMLTFLITSGGGPACFSEPQEVSLEQLLADYYENELAAKRKYLGKKIQITGSPEYIGLARESITRAGQKLKVWPTVTIKNRADYDLADPNLAISMLMAVECRFDHKKMKPLAKALDAMTARDKLTVTGTVDDIKSGRDIVLKKCAIKQTGGL